MARPTKKALVLAEKVGESPATVQRWIEDGFGPAGDIPPEEHFRKLAPLMGTGRDADIATLKMAADGYPERRLSGVPDKIRKDPATVKLLERLSERLSAPVGDEYHPDEPNIGRILTTEALLPIADALTGSQVGANDVDTFRFVIDTHNESAGIPSTPGWGDGELGLIADVVNQLASISRDAPRRYETADSAELVKGVVAARVMVDLLSLCSAHFANLGDEDQWRLVALFAPTAGAMAAALGVLVTQLGTPALDNIFGVYDDDSTIIESSGDGNTHEGATE
jgi:hypothetical protein